MTQHGYESGQLLDVERVAAITGLRPQSIDHLVTLRIIEPAATDQVRGTLFSLEQTPLLEVLDAMDTLNFRLEEMRDMVKVVETLGSEPGSERAGRYRIRLGVFIQSVTHRPVATEQQLESRQLLINALRHRYAWLTTRLE